MTKLPYDCGDFYCFRRIAYTDIVILDMAYVEATVTAYKDTAIVSIFKLGEEKEAIAFTKLLHEERVNKCT